MVGPRETVADVARRHFARKGKAPSLWEDFATAFKEGRAKTKAEKKTPAVKLWRLAVWIWLAGFLGAQSATSAARHEPKAGVIAQFAFEIAVSAAWPLVIACVVVNDTYGEIFVPPAKARRERSGAISI